MVFLKNQTTIIELQNKIDKLHKEAECKMKEIENKLNELNNEKKKVYCFVISAYAFLVLNTYCVVDFNRWDTLIFGIFFFPLYALICFSSGITRFSKREKEILQPFHDIKNEINKNKRKLKKIIKSQQNNIETQNKTTI